MQLSSVIMSKKVEGVRKDSLIILMYEGFAD